MAAARCRPLPAFPIGRISGQHAPLHLEPGRLSLALAQQAPLLLARELRKLGAVHAQVVITPARRRLGAARQRRHREPDRDHRHEAERKPKAHAAVPRRSVQALH